MSKSSLTLNLISLLMTADNLRAGISHTNFSHTDLCFLSHPTAGISLLLIQACQSPSFCLGAGLMLVCGTVNPVHYFPCTFVTGSRAGRIRFY